MEIPFPQPENPDIYSFGFDKLLNRGKQLPDSLISGENFNSEFNSFDGIISGNATIGERQAQTISDAINTSGQFIKDIINTNLDTSAKTILGDFTFGASGAIKMITDANNGLWISPTGILGKKAGVNTFAIDTSGNATFAGTLSAAAGTLGTITAGTLTGLLFRTAASGARIEIVSSTTRLNAFNASGQIAELNYGETAGIGILKLTPVGIAARAIEIIIPAALGADAKCITIDNPSTSISIDMTTAGSTGINIAGASTSGITIAHTGTGAGIDISGSGSAAGALTIGGGDYPSIDITQNGTATNSYGIRITRDTGAVKNAILIDDNANSSAATGIYIDRDGTIDNDIISAMRIDATNAGVGGKACGINFTGATIAAIMNVAANPTDPTGAGGVALGRIPIYVAGVLRYLAYY